MGVAAVSTGSVFIRLAEAPAPVVALWRTALATLLVLPFGLRRAVRELAATSRAERLAGAAAGLFLALHFATWIASLDHTTVAASTVIVCSTPIWVALAGPLVAGERVTRRAAVGIALAVVGAAVIGAGGGGRGALTGNLLALAGALTAALYVLIGRRLRPRVSLWTYVLATYGSAAAVLFVYVAGLGLPVVGYPPATYGWLVALAVIPQLVGHTSYNYALRYAPASYVSVAMLGEPIGATLLAWAFLSEVPGRATVAGGALLLFGIATVARSQQPGPLIAAPSNASSGEPGEGPLP